MNHSIKVVCYPDMIGVRHLLIEFVAAFGVTASVPELAPALAMFTLPAPAFQLPSSSFGHCILMIGGFLQRWPAAARLPLRR
ncbi:hypothetical protein ES707_12852 [subsurface metagenome]